MRQLELIILLMEIRISLKLTLIIGRRSLAQEVIRMFIVVMKL